MTDLHTSIDKFQFDNVFMNASGVRCYTKDELDELAQSDAGTLVTKSATQAKRLGNPSPRYARLELGSINSMGLPNEGLEYYLDYALNFQKAHPGKPIFLSVAGLSMEENLAMAHTIEDSDFNGLVEFNLSCPNVPGKPQTGYDFDRTQEVLTNLFSFFTKPAGVKLPPYFDLAQFDQMAAILNQFPLKFVNSINSLGNGLMIDPETDTALIKPKGGFGGIGGAYAKPIALANVRAFSQRLDPKIQLIGTGGVTNGRDAYDLILAGASLVQVGTLLQEEGPAAFTRLTRELRAVMQTKGYNAISDFKGQLKVLS
ncbi:dihydroorotate oxidase [Lacticaseibacillus casei]|uniref:dihydroorotate oxidase n=1 Tax=Lacticaseibacillus TaxID=2759736 RepID=UPI000667D7E7|nr:MULTISPECIES: dihydroorotate oxidase [Lacticaseibacillus]QVI37547.1 dihydroorotate oxidase [Lacticaseibacillus casei]QXG59334.1 dihydroorotate oxidase [Lacticaseibacillus casei]WFB40910.1 dihydroorotate oxidase [Lacticaseibacillus huelsenbergensis]